MNRALFALVLLAGSWAHAEQGVDMGTTSLEALVARIPEVGRNGIGSRNENWWPLGREIQESGREAIPLVRVHLRSDEPNVHLMAALILGRLIDEHGVDETTPAILEEMLGKTFPVDEFMDDSLLTIQRSIGDQASAAVVSLLSVAENPSVAVKNRVTALRMLRGAMKAPMEVESRLRAVKQSAEDPLLAWAAEGAIETMGGPPTVEVLTARLNADPDTPKLRDLAERGMSAKSASDSVERLMDHTNWEVRVAAARALGFMADERCISALRESLRNEDDWRLVFAAAESLGRLNAEAAAQDLEEVAESHWFPRVREAARRARRVIEGAEAYATPEERGFAFEFFAYKWPERGAQSKDIESLKELVEPEPGTLTEAELREETYTIEEFGEVGFRCGLRVEMGLLLGSDRGEWGGELVFTDSSGNDHILIKDNVVGIHRMPFGYLVATGLAYWMSHGNLWLVDVHSEPTPTARFWKALPGSPRMTGRLANGGLFVSCVGGDVVISPEGEIAMATEESIGLKGDAGP